MEQRFPDNSSQQSLHGQSFYPRDACELSRIVDLMFDYRGDVTLQLRSGETLQGYVYNRNSGSVEPYLEMFLKGGAAPRRVSYAAIDAVLFSGEDTASGKSWEAWVNKKLSEREAEASRSEARSRALGHL